MATLNDKIEIYVNEKLINKLNENRKVMIDALNLIEYMNGLTEVDNKYMENYTNRVLNVMSELQDQINN